MTNPMRATREHGLERLQEFLPRAGLHYAHNRNTDEAPQIRTNVSLLSAYLRHRLIEEREVIREVLRVHGADAGQKFVDEVIWRTYWKGYLEQRPQIWAAYRNRLQRFGHSERASAESLLSGKSGLICFDDWVQELRATGYLHNHARMWFASLWIFHFGMPWELGAEFFERFLWDGDPASNTLSWRWVAGLHTKGKTYRATAKNVCQFTNGRYSESSLSFDCERHIQIQADNLLQYENSGAQEEFSGADNSSTTTKHSAAHQIILWVHQDDLGLQDPGILDKVESAFIWISPSTNPFLNEAIRDTQKRLEARGIATHVLHDEEDLKEYLVQHRQAEIKSMRSFVGPARSQEICLNRHCEHLEITRSSLETRYDKALLPLASAGFFPFKQRAWPLLHELTTQ